jgi:hypothetical protein
VDDRSEYLEDLLHRSMLRITCSQSSLNATIALLDRTRKIVEDSARLLSQSHGLAREPFRRSWHRTAEWKQDLSGSQSWDKAFAEGETGSDRP